MIEVLASSGYSLVLHLLYTQRLLGTSGSWEGRESCLSLHFPHSPVRKGLALEESSLVRSECQEFGEAGREKASLGDLGEALYTYVLLSVNQELNTFCGKECPGKEVHWLDTPSLSRYLISMENSGIYATWPVVKVLLVGCWGHVLQDRHWVGRRWNSYRFQIWEILGFLNPLNLPSLFLSSARNSFCGHCYHLWSRNTDDKTQEWCIYVNVYTALYPGRAQQL